MAEKRKAKRLNNSDEVEITIFADGKRFPKEKIVHNLSKDISLLGARIKADTYLPINSFIKAEIKLKATHPTITIVGQVKWIKSIKNENCYEAGVEFISTPKDIIKNLNDYIKWLESLDNKDRKD